MEEEAYVEQETILSYHSNYKWTDAKTGLFSHIFSYGSFVSEEDHEHRY